MFIIGKGEDQGIVVGIEEETAFVVAVGIEQAVAGGIGIVHGQFPRQIAFLPTDEDVQPTVAAEIVEVHVVDRSRKALHALG